MNIKSKIFIALFTLSVLIYSCTKDKSPVPEVYSPLTSGKMEFNVFPEYNGTPIILDEPMKMSNGRTISFAEIAFLMTDIRLNSIPISNDALFNFREKGTSFLSLPEFEGVGKSFSTLIGVDSSFNHVDPASWSSNSVLNIQNIGDMYWTWNPGYIFIKLEGRVDTIPDNEIVLDHIFSYKIGTDGYARKLTVNNLNVFESNLIRSVNLKLDFKNVFENEISPIDLRTERSSHSTGKEDAAITEKMANNFVNSFITK